MLLIVNWSIDYIAFLLISITHAKFYCNIINQCFRLTVNCNYKIPYRSIASCNYSHFEFFCNNAIKIWISMNYSWAHQYIMVVEKTIKSILISSFSFSWIKNKSSQDDMKGIADWYRIALYFYIALKYFSKTNPSFYLYGIIV